MREIIVTGAATLLLLAGAAGASAAERPPIFAAAAHRYPIAVIRAAQRGNVNAEAELGWMYETGRGVPQNYYKAAKWYFLAAVRGHGDAQFQLGLLYNKCLGVPCDYVLSYMWLNLSASQAVGNDRDFKARMRDAVATKMTSVQVAAAQQMALTWYKTH
jgi:uncharacterized protein